MTSPLQWRPYSRGDRSALRGFVCTDPASAQWDGQGKSHPRPWELQAQSYIREHAPKPRLLQSMFLGWDDVGLAAVTAWQGQPDDPGQVLLQLVAVAMRHRGSGGGCAKNAILTAIATIKEQAREAGAARVLIEAHVDRRNLGSKRMNEAAGFVFDSRDGDDWEVWLYYEEL